MKFATMDNRQVCITAETKDELTAAIVLAMEGRAAKAFHESDGGLVVFWYIAEGAPYSPLLYEHSPEQVADVAWGWLEANRDKRRGDYTGGDVKNCDAFRLTQNSWGHAHDPDSDSSWQNGAFFLRPVAGWVGK